jgi:hypothetical protein
MHDERETRIKARAFELWHQQGSPEGRALGHWLQAEKEVDEDADESVAEDSAETVTLAAAPNPAR